MAKQKSKRLTFTLDRHAATSLKQRELARQIKPGEMTLTKKGRALMIQLLTDYAASSRDKPISVADSARPKQVA